MAEFVKVMKERQRMCNSYGTCCQCRINAIRNDICGVWIARNPKEAEQIIMEWSSEHPLKTNGMKFREVFGIDLKDKYLVTERAKEWACREYKGGAK